MFLSGNHIKGVFSKPAHPPGLQSNVLVGAAPYALPTQVGCNLAMVYHTPTQLATMAEVLAPLGYRRHVVG